VNFIAAPAVTTTATIITNITATTTTNDINRLIEIIIGIKE
jgi:hypothetical protein